MIHKGLRRIVLQALLFAPVFAFAQEKKVYEWEANPKQHNIPAAYSKESAVIILNEINIEYRNELGNIYIYRSLHRIVKVMDDKGIEAFNKTIIPMSNGKTLEFIKARTILSNGKIIEIGQDKVKQIKNEQGSPQYLFAMEGVEKNAEIELQYTERKPLSLFGAETYQFAIPIMKGNFSLNCPEKMVFRVKGYNGFPSGHDTLEDGTRYYNTSLSNIPPLHDEAYASEEAMQMRVEYKLDSLPKENPDKRMLTWKDLAKQLYNGYYGYSSKEEHTVQKYLESLGVNVDDEEADKIRKIEEGIKSDIVLDKDRSGDDVTKIEKIIANKATNEEGYLRLFCACFAVAEVKFELGMSTNRFEHPFDEEFENWNYMDTYVFYFQKQKKFLVPSSIYLRYPIVPSSLLTNKGMFTKVAINDDGERKAKADIREITPLSTDQSQNNIDAVVSFTGADLEPQLDVTHTFSGYTAVGLREAMVLLSKEKQKEVAQGIVNLSDKPEDVLKYNVENAAFKYYYDGKPLTISATIKANQLMEKAGKKYLFKIGDVIGRQQEMYQTVKRELPVVIEYPHSENRTITVTIPDGYKILNPETIRLHADDKDANGGTATMGFNSDYTLQGNKLVVTINEWYSQLHYPVSYFETFRKVINASADFNKVVLVLVKQ